jgi:hypothetical protein
MITTSSSMRVKPLPPLILFRMRLNICTPP